MTDQRTAFERDTDEIAPKAQPPTGTPESAAQFSGTLKMLHESFFGVSGSPDIKPCPVCGSKSIHTSSIAGMNYIACNNAGCYMPVVPADIWNRLSEAAALWEAVGVLASACEDGNLELLVWASLAGQRAALVVERGTANIKAEAKTIEGFAAALIALAARAQEEGKGSES